jgi:Tfp pilus assembly protein PilN
MIKVNLIPSEYLEKLNRRAIIAKAVAAGVLIAAAVVLASVWHFTEQKTSEIKMHRLQAELNSLQADVARAKAIEAEIAEVNRYLDSIGSIKQGRLVYPRFMLDIISGMPGTIWLGGISTTLNGPTLGAMFPVSSRSAYDLAYWINALETNTAKYSGVTVSAIAVSDSESGKTLTTTISVKYRCQ